MPVTLECDLLKLLISAFTILKFYSAPNSLISISFNLSNFCQGLLSVTQGRLSARMYLVSFSHPLYQTMRYVGKATNLGMRVARIIKR